ncbi:hypothetical protein LB452_01430 [Psychroflexus sp. CAK8W]|uniref:Uncharacterized protein n=1 Tax=Psychroflexus longus TaxID=2873596 RepID=A0ABS7XHT9_9FLAO|nr:hypothetical protein [Psychroflexus longus]MBZ9777572.1 hypothetical protein [Psychroflexus longus]
MKKYLFIISIFSLILGSCKSDTKTSDSDQKFVEAKSISELNTVLGEFIYSDSVAVFKKKEIIYGVVMNSRAKDLIAQVKEINSDPFASFDVTLKVDVRENPVKDAWPQVIDIQNIINVKPSQNDDGLRLDK